MGTFTPVLCFISLLISFTYLTDAIPVSDTEKEIGGISTDSHNPTCTSTVADVMTRTKNYEMSFKVQVLPKHCAEDQKTSNKPPLTLRESQPSKPVLRQSLNSPPTVTYQGRPSAVESTKESKSFSYAGEAINDKLVQTPQEPSGDGIKVDQGVTTSPSDTNEANYPIKKQSIEIPPDAKSDGTPPSNESSTAEQKDSLNADSNPLPSVNEQGTKPENNPEIDGPNKPLLASEEKVKPLAPKTDNKSKSK